MTYALGAPPTRAPSPCLVADGFGLAIRVERGHLVIEDGTGSERRVRRLPRITRDVRRIMILGHTGHITLEALRWCANVGIALVQLDTSGRILSLSAVPGLDDSRLRRAQAAALGTDTGLAIAQSLLTAKVGGQASVARTMLNQYLLADQIGAVGDQLADAPSTDELLQLEARAANLYFSGWTNRVNVSWATRDAAKVPSHWHTFTSRDSVITRGRTPRRATNPINALLNYCYGIAEAECSIALATVGLDPGLGVLHADRKARDSLALDLLEVVRPDVDRYVLDMLTRRHFRAADFCETPDGQCKLMPPLTHDLAHTTTLWAQAVAPWAESITHQLRERPDGRRPTPLTRANVKAHQLRGTTKRRPRGEAQPPVPVYTCRDCGAQLGSPQRKLCDACWSVTRNQLAADRARRGAAALAARRADGIDPTNTAEAAKKRSATLSARKRQQLAWEQGATGAAQTTDYDRDIQPRLAALPLARIRQATGLSISAASRIRAGTLRPHRRHWGPLAGLVANQHAARSGAPADPPPSA